MYTQCQNCQAIFLVSMRDVASSNGLLRCGECLQVFDSSLSMSTTMQIPFSEMNIDRSSSREVSPEKIQTMKAIDSRQQRSQKKQINFSHSQKNTLKTKNRSTNKTRVKKNTPHAKAKHRKHTSVKDFIVSEWPILATVLLGLLLLFQVGFNYRHLIFDRPTHAPEKIQMLNHNIFAHPIEKNTLLISASIENTADFDQPYPFLEVRLTNSKTELVALRRFSPNEYLDNYSPSTLLSKKRPTSIKLKIQDPGNQATRFQFNFL